MSEIATRQATKTDVVRSNPIAMMMNKLAENPTPENVEALCKLADKFVEMDAREAQKYFNEAFAEMQANMPAIVCDKKGPWGGDYADKESIMVQIRPTLQRYGFSVRFEHPPAADATHLATVCVLSHAGGHVVSSAPMVTRAGRPNKMMTEIQVDAGGYYAGERYALCSMLNIRADKMDADAKFLGVLLSPDELSDLKRRAFAVGANEENIFRMADVGGWDEIRTGAVPLLMGFFTEKERAKGKVKPTSHANSPPAASSAPSEAEQEAIRKAEREGR